MHENQMSITATEPTQMQMTKGEEETMFAKHSLPHVPAAPLPNPGPRCQHGQDKETLLKALSGQKTTWQEAWHTSTFKVQTAATHSSARVWREDQVM